MTTTGTDRAGQRVWFHVCTSLVPKPMTVVISLGTRLIVCMRTRLENGVLRNRQQPGSVENTFFDHSKFCWVVGKLRGLTRQAVEQRKKEEYEKWHFCYCTLLRLAVFRMVFEKLYQSCWSQRHSKRKPGCLKAFSAFVVKLYAFCLSIACIARRRHPYIDSLPTLL